MNRITAMDITARTAEENLPSASRLAQAVYDSVAMESSSPIPLLCKAVQRALYADRASTEAP